MKICTIALLGIFTSQFAVTSTASAHQLSVTRENTSNWGQSAGQVARAIKSCPFEVPSQVVTIFEWSQAKYGAEHAKMFEIGFNEIDTQFKKKAKSVVCNAIVSTIGPNGTVVESFVIPNASPVSEAESVDHAWMNDVFPIAEQVFDDEMFISMAVMQAALIYAADKCKGKADPNAESAVTLVALQEPEKMKRYLVIALTAINRQAIEIGTRKQCKNISDGYGPSGNINKGAWRPLR